MTQTTDPVTRWLAGEDNAELPSLAEIDARIRELESEISRTRTLRTGVAMVVGALDKDSRPAEPRSATNIPSRPGSTRDFINRVFDGAEGRPLSVPEIEVRMLAMGWNTRSKAPQGSISSVLSDTYRYKRESRGLWVRVR